jgi:hypothetical protein
MEDSKPLSPAIAQIQKSLSPYIKSRQEVAEIRRILTAHLKSHVEGDEALVSPISLVGESANVKPTASSTRGLRKEYLRALKANIKARCEYERLSNVSYKAAEAKPETGSLDTFFALVKERQRLERLRILQNYIDGLAARNSTATSFLEATTESTSSLPRVPPEIVGIGNGSDPQSSAMNLDELVQALEKDVLRAKVQLKSEKDILAEAHAAHHKSTSSSQRASSEHMLEALGRTRNELIQWVEEELGKAGESPSDENGVPDQNSVSKTSIERKIQDIQKQYTQYIQDRKQFLNAMEPPAIPDVPSQSPPTSTPLNCSEPPETDPMARLIIPYLTDLMAISSEQKSLLQQKSHLTVSLSKLHKSTLQTFDRLADESHLLPTYPLPSPNPKTQPYRLAPSFADEMTIKENPGVSHRARPWMYAAGEAAIATMEVVLGHVDDGKSGIEESRQMIAALEQLLGKSGQSGAQRGRETDGDSEEDIWVQKPLSRRRTLTLSKRANEAAQTNASAGDIWSSLDGQLGVINREDGN